jgi:TPR repeat protein
MATLTAAPEDEVDCCPICLESFPPTERNTMRTLCCGKGIHRACHAKHQTSNMIHKNLCVLCRTPMFLEEQVEERLEAETMWATQGKPWAHAMLGWRYLEGIDVEQSYANAFDEFTIAANHGHTEAMQQLSMLILAGLGPVESNFELSRFWILKAANLGDEGAIFAVKVREFMMPTEGGEEGEEAFVVKPTYCSYCSMPHDIDSNKLTRCSGCRLSYYCNSECQASHWRLEDGGHKKLCKIYSEAVTMKNAGATPTELSTHFSDPDNRHIQAYQTKSECQRQPLEIGSCKTEASRSFAKNIPMQSQ